MADNIESLMEEQRWDQVRSYFENNPEEAKRMVNPRFGWTKLHWLCTTGSTPSSLIDFVASLYPEAITMPDARYGDTPLHLACRNAQVTSSKPKYLLNRLVEFQSQNSSASDSSMFDGVLIRNRFGGTALHSACNHNATLEVLEALVNLNPKLLAVATLDGIYPLSALYTAYIQTIPGYMAVARMLNGEEVHSSHFDRFWKKVVFLTTADMRDQKVPDPSRLILHGLVRRSCLLVNFYKLALKCDPTLAMAADEQGDLALHLLVDHRPFRLKEREAIEATLEASTEAASKRNNAGSLPLLTAIRNKIPWYCGMDLIAEAAPMTVQRRDVETNLLPFQLAAAVGGKSALDTIFQLLSMQPDLLLLNHNSNASLEGTL